MKVVILAGGLGTRISEETGSRPKPMIEVGGKPIIWHIMKIYSSFGLTDFIVCLGYRGYAIKEYFANYGLHMSDVTIDMKNNRRTILNSSVEPWKITLVDTGEETMTGGRIKRIRSYLKNDDFCLTYGDGVSDVRIPEVIKLHKREKRLATITAVQMPGRFGALTIKSNRVLKFEEKPRGDGGWINGGFFVLSPKVVDYVTDDASVWEQEPLESLARNKQLTVYRHTGFWQPLDTLRDKTHLEKLWQLGRAPWKVWNEH